jgi:hypothetical protein
VPTRRVWRYKARVSAMTKFEWEFFLVQDVAGFDRLAERQGEEGSMFFELYYNDGWKHVYAMHRAEIEAERRHRGWGRRQRRFVMTGYYDRGITLAHDARREREMKFWQEWRAAEGWKSETFAQYLERMQKEGASHERR